MTKAKTIDEVCGMPKGSFAKFIQKKQRYQILLQQITRTRIKAKCSRSVFRRCFYKAKGLYLKAVVFLIMLRDFSRGFLLRDIYM